MNELALFNSLFGGNDTGFPFPDVYRVQTCGVPKVDVREDKDAYLLDMDLPGRTDKDIDINLKDGVLTIASTTEKKAEHNEKDSGKAQWLIRERSCSSFSRRFSLPDDVDADAVSASFKDGVLSVRLPRSKTANTEKKIAITAA
ncbi:MAG: Hsp20/alpha crystallin family protein [Treponema sp.]|nr:Hsp20/alpha crystallin family protein [Treponema sp.]